MQPALLVSAPDAACVTIALLHASCYMSAQHPRYTM